MKTRIILFFAIVLLISSCIPQNKIEILRDPIETKKTYNLPSVGENIIKSNDELYITVTSIDDPVFNFLGTSDQNQTGLGNDMSVTLISYNVHLDGNIQFPILGEVYLAGLSIKEARKKLEELLKGYLNQPSVNIKFAYKKVTIMGEVNRPGNFSYSKDKINILEALAIAGDLTVHSNRKEIYLMRKNQNEITKMKLDLTNDNIVFSEYFYVQPDDIIYVKPRKSVKWRVVATPLSLIFSTIAATLLTLNFFEVGPSSNP